MHTFFSKRLIDYGLLKQFRDIGIIAGGALAAGLLAFGVIMLTDNYWLMLFGGGLMSAGAYAGIQYLFNRRLFLDVLSLKDYFLKNGHGGHLDT